MLKYVNETFLSQFSSIHQIILFNYNEREYDDDYYSQPGALFRLMPPEEQQLLFENTARAMGDAELFIKERHVRNCFKADPAYGIGVAKALGIKMPDMK